LRQQPPSAKKQQILFEVSQAGEQICTNPNGVIGPMQLILEKEVFG